MLYTFLDLFLPGIQKLICRITAREQIDIGRFGMNHDLQPVVSQSCTKKHGDWPRLRTTGGDCWFMDVHGSFCFNLQNDLDALDALDCSGAGVRPLGSTLS